MTTSEIRKGKEFSSGQKRRRKEEVAYHCEGCGKEIVGKRTHNHPQQAALEAHHEPAIVHGGGNNRRLTDGQVPTKLRVLCGPNTCHRVADTLEIQHGVEFSYVVTMLGKYPFQQYRRQLEKGRIDKVEERVLRRIHKKEHPSWFIFAPRRAQQSVTV